jgi:hypothetical protein
VKKGFGFFCFLLDISPPARIIKFSPPGGVVADDAVVAVEDVDVVFELQEVGKM